MTLRDIWIQMVSQTRRKCQFLLSGTISRQNGRFFFFPAPSACSHGGSVAALKYISEPPFRFSSGFDALIALLMHYLLAFSWFCLPFDAFSVHAYLSWCNCPSVCSLVWCSLFISLGTPEYHLGEWHAESFKVMKFSGPCSFLFFNLCWGPFSELFWGLDLILGLLR